MPRFGFNISVQSAFSFRRNMTNIAGIVNNGPASYQTELVAAYEKFTDLVNEGRAIVDDTEKLPLRP